MRACLPLRRVCLETDRTLRVRPFFARALRGELRDEASLDFVVQLGALVRSVAPDAVVIEQLMQEDIAFFRRGSALGSRPACAAVRHFRAAVRSYLRVLEPEVVLSTGFTVFGTSWTIDATDRVRARTRRTPSLLAHLGREGPASLLRLETLISEGAVDGPCIYAFAELSRGALLGLSADLESTWPAPLLARSFVFGEESSP